MTPILTTFIANFYSVISSSGHCITCTISHGVAICGMKEPHCGLFSGKVSSVTTQSSSQIWSPLVVLTVMVRRHERHLVSLQRPAAAIKSNQIKSNQIKSNFIKQREHNS